MTHHPAFLFRSRATKLLLVLRISVSVGVGWPITMSCRFLSWSRCLLEETQIYTADCGRFIHGKGSAAGNTAANGCT